MAQPGSLRPYQPPVGAFSAAQGGLPEEAASEEDSPLFQADDFRIWCMKVIPCTKRFVHDWTVCPFAHAGEKAVRRDPRTHNYTGIACPDMKKQSSCIRGDKCPYAHNVFEYWLHPTRYRTQLCNDGPTCKRSICFFAHSLEELRVPAVKPYVSPEALARASLEAIQQNPHPLGQQLPNPVVSMRAQVALGMQRSSSGGTPRSSMPYSANAAGNQGGGYSTPSPMAQYPPHPAAQQQHAQHQSPPSMGFAPPPQQAQYVGYYGQQQAAGANGQYPQSHMQRLPRASMDYAPTGARRTSLDGVALSLTPAAPHWGADGGMGGFPPSPAAPAPGWAPDFGAVGSLPNSGRYSSGHPGSYQQGSGSSGGSGTAPNSCRPSFDNAAYSLGGAGQHPLRLSSGSLALGRLSHDSLVGLDAVRHSLGSDCSDRAASPGSGGESAGGIGAADLAQSLATLKIALTQQHVAAASGSNHEIVISTLHQILKDAIAQHGGKLPNLGPIPGMAGLLPGSPPDGAPTPASLASSSFFAPADLQQAQPSSPAPTPQRLSAGSAHAPQQQPWISTMGNIKWDGPAAAAAANSPTAVGADARRSSESAGSHE